MKTCKIHGEYKPQKICFGNSVLYSSCPKCADDYAKEEKKEKRRELLKRSGVPIRFENKGFDSFVTSNKKAEEIKLTMKKYADNFKGIKPHGTSLILSGNPGTGKTHLGCSIVLNLLDQGEMALYRSFYDIVAEMRNMFSSDEKDVLIIGKYLNVRLLILDEVGVQCSSDFEKDLLFRIINSRYENKRPTILLTNLNYGDLEKVIGQRIIDRFNEKKGGFYTFDWESYRK
ncbi:MAG: ATP-binding protein [Desulfobacterales bacterium]|nr:ATP-binding protein [Desulfobacterales bacterium]MCP4161194.1 ATP-binding protein [Deltaproteobacteria bacterium]